MAEEVSNEGIGKVPEGAKSSETEIQPLTITISPETQQGLLSSLMFGGLSMDTRDEVAGQVTNPEEMRKIAGVRELFTDIAQNAGIEIDENAALSLGLVDFVPTDTLDRLAETENPLRQHAHYFRHKKRIEAETQPVKPSQGPRS